MWRYANAIRTEIAWESNRLPDYQDAQGPQGRVAEIVFIIELLVRRRDVHLTPGEGDPSLLAFH